MGFDFLLMLDCYMVLIVLYIVKLVRVLEFLGLKWIEEFLFLDSYDGYREVCEVLRSFMVLFIIVEYEYSCYGY